MAKVQIHFAGNSSRIEAVRQLFLPAAAGLHLAIFSVIFFSERVLEGLSIFCQRVSKSQNIYCLKEFVDRFSLNMSQIKDHPRFRGG